VSYRVEDVPGATGLRSVIIYVTWREKGRDHLFTLPIMVDELE